ncbi:hypothetical protein HYW83_03990 [Candidatus Peregrinibacteria bacterium]|nr:hypothetical protein [Candidatus Peregrinibacteria bacterium]
MANFLKIACITLIASLGFSGCGTDALGDRYVGFAQCLTQKNATMYGVYWCSHCEDQKRLFGKEGFREVNYVECDRRGKNAKPELCSAKNIESTPTWEFADGSRIEGKIPLEVLAQKTGCSLPAEAK